MSSSFYPRLALTNIKKNAKNYIPYVLTSIGMIIMFYTLCNISLNKGINNIYGGDSVKIVLGFGNYVIAIFSAIFLFYTNSFLIKNRKKEIGLYNILGMEKKHIGKVLTFETIIIALISIVAGLLLGIVFCKLLFFIFVKILGDIVILKFSFAFEAMLRAIVLFAGIFAVTLIYNRLQIRLTNPIELLKGGQHGEKEPKARWILAIIGFVALVVAYYIALTTESPLDSIMQFFIAVILVIVGTHFLFMAGSIVLLKIMRNNKKFYYQTNHFTSISGMIYRMKQNAAGLANICILSTAVLVILSTTVSLYIGLEDELEFRFPSEVQIDNCYNSEEETEELENIITDINKKYNVEVSNLKSYCTGSVFAKLKGTVFEKTNDLYGSESAYIKIFTLEDYNKLLGTQKTLSENEVIFLSTKNDYKENEVKLANKTFLIKEEIDSLPIAGDFAKHIMDTYYIIVNDMDTLKSITMAMNEKEMQERSLVHSYTYDMNPNMDNYDEYVKEVTQKLEESKLLVNQLDFREANRENFRAMYGSLFFIGSFLGTLFLMATVLIIYYKQVSEGYDDKERFSIMQKVGMSKTEVKSTIKSQILMVFFVPLATAAIHVAFAFKILTKLLNVMNLFNTPLFAACTVSCVLIFAVIYILVYSMTAKAYFNIVNETF